MKFHRKHPSFIEDITKNILVSFFWSQCRHRKLHPVLLYALCSNGMYYIQLQVG